MPQPVVKSASAAAARRLTGAAKDLVGARLADWLRYPRPMRFTSGESRSASLLHGQAARRRSVCPMVSSMLAR